MSKQEHTPGLLTTRQAIIPTDGAYDFAIAAEIDDRRLPVAEAFGRCSETDFLPAEDNARRIVASWNACDGISTESLEDGVIAEMREALKAAEEYMAFRATSHSEPVPLRRVQAVIAKLK